MTPSWLSVFPWSKKEKEELQGGSGDSLTWAAVTLASGVQAWGAPYSTQITAGSDGKIAVLSGQLKLTGAKANGALVATLPVGYRPPHKKIVHCIDANNPSSSGLIGLALEPNGEVKTVAELGESKAPSLDGVVFRTAA